MGDQYQITLHSAKTHKADRCGSTNRKKKIQCTGINNAYRTIHTDHRIHGSSAADRKRGTHKATASPTDARAKAATAAGATPQTQIKARHTAITAAHTRPKT